MLCEKCQKNTANVHFTQIINGNKVEMYLCENCSQEKEQIGFGPSFSIHDFLSGFMGVQPASPFAEPASKPLVCQQCGMSYDEFKKVGRFGCSNCYELYGDRIKPLLKRLHGSMNHHGKMPQSYQKNLEASKEIEALKELLNTAIRTEEYEKAAELRDKIKEIEAKGSV